MMMLSIQVIDGEVNRLHLFNGDQEKYDILFNTLKSNTIIFFKNIAFVGLFSVQAVLAGDYILGISSILLARIDNSDVILLLSRVIQDLVRGMLYLLILFNSHKEIYFKVSLCNYQRKKVMPNNFKII